jgi:hypothetical protein
MHVEAIREKGEPDTACPVFCQDLGYSSTDEELLKNLNMTVLESPMGFLEVDRSSVVIGIGPDVPVKQIVADDERYWPAMIVWGEI